MTRSKNSRRDKFLASIPEVSIETSNIHERCKFNLSFFDDSQVGQSFSDWNKPTGADSLDSLLNKIKSYTKHSLDYWQNQRSGGGGLKIFEIYGDFPLNSRFKHPKHVPHDVRWARFRLGNMVRLIGFVVPDSECGKLKYFGKNGYVVDSNTFYVVFLDKNHQFYVSEKA